MRKYQYYNTNDDGDRDGYGVNWMSQTFTPEENHLVGSVKLKLFRVGDPGQITVSIKAASAGVAVGADLCSGTIEGTDITLDTNGEFYEISLADGYSLSKDVQYAIVVRAPDGDSSNKVSWRADITTPSYTGGTYCSSSDSGISWSTFSGVDCMFEVWGTGPPSPTTITWGNLPKSQLSLEKIEEAIARMILNHENDPNAHLEIGQSLQSHKASEIIDHLMGSVVADKFSLKQVTVSTSFESLDGWSTRGLAAQLIWPGVLIHCGSVLDAETSLDTEPTSVFRSQDIEKNLFFQTTVKIGTSEEELMQIWTGEIRAGEDGDGFGFETSGDKLYGVFYNWGDRTTVELMTTPIGDETVLRAQASTDGSKITFYVDGIDKGYLDVPTLTDPGDLSMHFLIKNKVENTDAILRMESLLISRDK